jgi:hypothetical protein
MSIIRLLPQKKALSAIFINIFALYPIGPESHAIAQLLGFLPGHIERQIFMPDMLLFRIPRCSAAVCAAAVLTTGAEGKISFTYP